MQFSADITKLLESRHRLPELELTSSFTLLLGSSGPGSDILPAQHPGLPTALKTTQGLFAVSCN